MKRGTIIAIVVGALIVLGAAAGVATPLMPRTKPDPVPLEISKLASLESPPAAVTLRGTAHYRGVVNQTVPASLTGPAKEYAVYGLFPLHDTMGK